MGGADDGRPIAATGWGDQRGSGPSDRSTLEDVLPRDSLGPWGKLYATLEEDLAHFDDRQFRAFIGILCRSIRGRGEIPKLKPLRAIYGADVVDFLIEEGRLTADGNAVTVTGADVYNAPADPTNAERQRRYRERVHGWSNGRNNADNGVTTALSPNAISDGSSLSSPVEESSLAEGDESAPSSRVNVGVSEDWILLAKLMEDLTQQPFALSNPWSKMSLMALDLIRRHGWPKFSERARIVAGRIPNPGVDEIIFGVNGTLRRSVDAADLQAEERKSEIDDSLQRRIERTQLSLHFQHVEASEHPQCPACRGEVAL